MTNSNDILLFLCFFIVFIGAHAQVNDSIPDTQLEPPETVVVADIEVKKDTVNTFKRIKLDGISAVVGDYLILDSDIEKTLIDLRSQGASMDDITHCGLLGKLMEDR
ncbi:MAG: peptidylprolyl isomerase, partial [Eudoraea sp.]